jgi:predicted O-methyltransferase YrrM
LGAGTIAAYGRPGDTIVFYEIDPAIERIARRDFTFLAESDAEIKVVLGDARLSLEREPSRNYDLLVLDAFSGNAPPLHLLTVEAFGIYIRHLATDGLIAVQGVAQVPDIRSVRTRRRNGAWLDGRPCYRSHDQRMDRRGTREGTSRSSTSRRGAEASRYDRYPPLDRRLHRYPAGAAGRQRLRSGQRWRERPGGTAA